MNFVDIWKQTDDLKKLGIGFSLGVISVLLTILVIDTIKPNKKESN